MVQAFARPGARTSDCNIASAVASDRAPQKIAPTPDRLSGSVPVAPLPVRQRSHVGPLYRLHEALLGRPTVRLARQLETSQWMSPVELRALQLSKLNRLLEHARLRCPYYARHPRYQTAAIRTIEDFHELPVMTRDALRRNAYKMRWPGMPRKKMLHWTRGSTDVPVPFFWDRNRQAWDKANRLRGLAWQHLSAHDRELHIWPVDPPLTPASRFKEQLRTLRDRLLRDRQFDSLTVSPQLIDRVWRAWRGFDPVVVTAFPSVLCNLIQWTGGLRIARLNPSLRRVHATGEILYNWQRQLIEQSFGVPVFESYGVQEAGAIAFECEHGNWHCSDESLLVEVLGRDSRPVAPGRVGEVVVTGLDSFAMPLIRYSTGDVVRAGATRCRCGRGLSVIEPLMGRRSDFLKSDAGHRVGPRDVVESLSGLVENGGFQIVQQPDGLVAVEMLSGACHAGTDAVQQQLRRVLGRRTVCFQTVATLERSAYGKCRFVRSA